MGVGDTYPARARPIHVVISRHDADPARVHLRGGGELGDPRPGVLILRRRGAEGDVAGDEDRVRTLRSVLADVAENRPRHVALLEAMVSAAGSKVDIGDMDPAVGEGLGGERLHPGDTRSQSDVAGMMSTVVDPGIWNFCIIPPPLRFRS